MACALNEILDLCSSHYPVLPKQIRQDNLAPLLLSCHQGRGRGGRARPLITSKPIGTKRKLRRYNRAFATHRGRDHKCKGF